MSRSQNTKCCWWYTDRWLSSFSLDFLYHCEATNKLKATPTTSIVSPPQEGKQEQRSVLTVETMLNTTQKKRRSRLHLSASQKTWKSNLPAETAGCTSSAMDGHYQCFIRDHPPNTHTHNISVSDHMHEWTHTSTHSPRWQRLMEGWNSDITWTLIRFKHCLN